MFDVQKNSPISYDTEFIRHKMEIPILLNYKIPNSKHQITNKSPVCVRTRTGRQISIFNDQNRYGFGILNFGHCNLFDIYDLLFVISGKEIPILSS